MAGRGRGRGSAFSYTAEVLGLGRGADAIPASVVQPPPPFPTLEFKPVPLVVGDSVEYMLLLKQEFRTGMRDSLFYIKPLDKKKDIQRYSDKYQPQATDELWIPNFKKLPKELNYMVKRRRASKKLEIKPKVTSRPSINKKEAGKEIVKALVTLEKEEEEHKKSADTAGQKEENEQSGEEEEAYYDDEEEEEGNDYMASYFDPGEEFLDDDDGNDEGPTY